MGFFSDLKEDLSQAVNELKPDAEQREAAAKSREEAATPEGMQRNIDTVELPKEMPQTGESAVAAAPEVSEAAKPDVPETDLQDSDWSSADVSEAVQEEIAKAEEIAAAVEEAMAVAEEQRSEGQDNTNIESVLDNVLAQEPVEEEDDKVEIKGAERNMDSYAARTVSDETAVITEGMTITGDLVSEGSADIIGCVNGNIELLGKLNVTGHINGNSKATEIYAEGAKINGEIVSEGAVKIGASSVIIGNITATSAAIAGAVKGDIDVKGPVILDASAIVMGNIKSKSVQINNGAVIEGMCSQCYADVSPSSFFDAYKPDNKKAKQK